MTQTLKQQLAARRFIAGTFIKTPHYQTVEILARTELEVLCLDAEHAPFTRQDLDMAVIAAQGNTDLLVRLPSDQKTEILNALDVGASGVVIPHVTTAQQLQRIVSNCFYGAGGRGYAGSTRSAGFTQRGIATNLERNKETVVIAQLEDLEALDNLDALMQVNGCDCYFIGRIDLCVALGETDPKALAVVEQVTAIVEAANRYQRTVGMFVGDLTEIPHWRALGVSLFLLSSDHNFLLSGANQLVNTVKSSLD